MVRTLWKPLITVRLRVSLAFHVFANRFAKLTGAALIWLYYHDTAYHERPFQFSVEQVGHLAMFVVDDSFGK